MSTLQLIKRNQTITIRRRCTITNELFSVTLTMCKYKAWKLGIKNKLMFKRYTDDQYRFLTEDVTPEEHKIFTKN